MGRREIPVFEDALRMATFFHVSEVDHAVGQVLQPGSWGKMTRQFGNGWQLSVEDAKTLAWESNLETARSPSE
jgi:hypothetical protein